MNKIKFLVAMFAITLSTLGIYSCAKEDKSKVDAPVASQSELFGESCLESTSCSPYLPETISDVTLPAYPGCVFKVQVYTCIQQDVILGTEIFVGNYKLLDASECPKLWEAWSNLVLDPKSQDGKINDFVNNLDQQVYARLEDYLYAKHGNVVGCSSSLGTLNISFVKATCNTMCAHVYERKEDFPDIIGDESIDNEVTESRSTGKYGILVRTNCDTDGCCQRRTSICYNPVTNEVEKTTTSTATHGASCSGGIPDQPTTGGGVYVKCLPCSFSCN